jgi:hypothetical protein
MFYIDAALKTERHTQTCFSLTLITHGERMVMQSVPRSAREDREQGVFGRSGAVRTYFVHCRV